MGYDGSFSLSNGGIAMMELTASDVSALLPFCPHLFTVRH